MYNSTPSTSSSPPRDPRPAARAHRLDRTKTAFAASAADCTICLDPLASGPVHALEACDHSYHALCLKEMLADWRRRNPVLLRALLEFGPTRPSPRCPLCRKNLTSGDLLRLRNEKRLVCVRYDFFRDDAHLLPDRRFYSAVVETQGPGKRAVDRTRYVSPSWDLLHLPWTHSGPGYRKCYSLLADFEVEVADPSRDLFAVFVRLTGTASEPFDTEHKYVVRADSLRREGWFDWTAGGDDASPPPRRYFEDGSDVIDIRTDEEMEPSPPPSPDLPSLAEIFENSSNFSEEESGRPLPPPPAGETREEGDDTREKNDGPLVTGWFSLASPVYNPDAASVPDNSPASPVPSTSFDPACRCCDCCGMSRDRPLVEKRKKRTRLSSHERRERDRSREVARERRLLDKLRARVQKQRDAAEGVSQALEEWARHRRRTVADNITTSELGPSPARLRWKADEVRKAAEELVRALK